jgi:recombination directionality factor gp3-like protein
MPITGLTDDIQPRFFNRIRLGVEEEMSGTDKNGNQKTKPVNTDHFVIEEAPEVEAVYGKNPKELHVMFYSYNKDLTMPTWNKFYDASGMLLCRGTGWSAQKPGVAAWRAHQIKNVPDLTAEPGDIDNSFKRLCKGKDCIHFGKTGCRRVSQIRFMLPLVNPLAVYEVTTGSINTMLDIGSILDSLGNMPVPKLGFVNPVYKIFKVAQKKGKLDDNNKKFTANFKYMTAELDTGFWKENGHKVLHKFKEVYGIDFVKEHMAELQQMGGAMVANRQVLDQQVAGSIDAELTPLPENIVIPTVIKEAAPEEQSTQAAATEIQKTIDVAKDPDVISAVKAIYHPKPVNDAVLASVVKKYKTKEAILAAASKAMQKTQPPTSQKPVAQPTGVGDSIL